MKVIVAGSRDIIDFSIVKEAIEKSALDITEIVSGCARGVDSLGEQWAYKNNIPVKAFPADWNKHPRAAGIIRNAQMAKYADALIAVWDGKSRGTANMIMEAQRNKLKVYICKI